MPSILEPIAAGIVVSLINKYILPKLDLFRPCAAPPMRSRLKKTACRLPAAPQPRVPSITSTSERVWCVHLSKKIMAG